MSLVAQKRTKYSGFFDFGGWNLNLNFQFRRYFLNRKSN